VVPTLLRAITEEVNCPRDGIFRLHDFREIASFKRKEISTHTKWQRELYPISPIVRARVFESNEAWRQAKMLIILLVVLLLLSLGSLPTWPHSRTWGYYPSGGLGLVVVILLVLLLLGRI